MRQILEEQFWTFNSYNKQNLPLFASDAYEKILPYIQEFLCAEHPYRDGAVCPFVPAAIKHERIYFATCATNDSMEGHSKRIQECVEFYLERRSLNRGFGALVILFPENFDIGKLLDLHFANKEICIVNSLMLGALYSTNQAPSLHNSEYFPLRTPDPVLVIRDLVISDLMFLNPRHYNMSKRIVFLESFIGRFKEQAGSISQREVEKARELYRRYVRKRRYMRIAAFVAVTLLILLVYYCS